jgi:hypothetical protein
MVAVLIPDIDAFEERAAIVKFEERLTRELAEDLAAWAQGFLGLITTGSGSPTTW